MNQPAARRMSTARVALGTAYAAIDAANARDPNVESLDGEARPKELVYGQRMTHWLEWLYPDAGEALKIAARCQHIERWTSPRSDYPEGRKGYLAWRQDLKNFHARRAGDLLRSLGYDESLIAHVGDLVRKKRLKQDPESQALEDVACIVFLAHYFADFSAQHEEQKIDDILRKTWRKMSAHGREAALSLDLGDAVSAHVSRALSALDQSDTDISDVVGR